MTLTSVDAPGNKVQGPQLTRLRADVARLLGRSNHRFPGAMPASLCRKHIHELQEEDYLVCEKSDGMRHLLYFTQDRYGNESQYFINRKNEFWAVPRATFFCPAPRERRGFHIDTLVDGELVMEKTASGELVAKYLAFDCLVLDGERLMRWTLDQRLSQLRQELYNPYWRAFKESHRRFGPQHFSMELKKMVSSYAVEHIFKEIIPSLAHGNDGLIFTCRKSGYKFGSDPKILKWKPETENSIDFRLRLEFPQIQPDDSSAEHCLNLSGLPIFHLLINAGEKEGDVRFSTMHVEMDEWEAFKAETKPVNNRIVECFMDEKKRWRYMRFRDDKINANYTSTVDSVIESITDRVTGEDLEKAASNIRKKWMQRADRERRSQAENTISRPMRQRRCYPEPFHGSNMKRHCHSGWRQRLC
ncbi:BgTH12-06255 [Blumeria graminis f. sp. triticale]|uniref:mRNA-capping enzyme subunit alpha n=1 Tax=Blumeria graminis f. sp. triticale TaxID=1689686 RepID=A0A9W4CXA9_BLUGR|nr:BgTH12-06255 [Blumeria graminis f. sp. triticale]